MRSMFLRCFLSCSFFADPLAFVSAADDSRLVQLRSGKFVDALEQRLAHCTSIDEDAWQRVLFDCEKRGLILCSVDDYILAYEEMLIPPMAYAYTRTTTGCGPNRHVLVAGGGAYLEEVDGCHTNTGCWPDRYFRCCSHADDMLGPIDDRMSTRQSSIQSCVADEDFSNAFRNPFQTYFDSVVDGRGIDKWSHYFDVYYAHFSRFIGQEVHIVEIGVQSGGSLDMWKHVFGSNAHVYGIDIDPATKLFEDERTKIFIGDQGDRKFWATFFEQVPQIDILIDDGGHLLDLMTVSLEEIHPRMSRNGVYLIEDITGDANPMWQYLTDTFLLGSPAGVGAIHVYPYVIVLEMSRGNGIDKIVQRSRLKDDVLQEGSVFCAGKQDSSLSHRIQLLQTELFPAQPEAIRSVDEWPCFGSLVDLPSNAAVLLAFGATPSNLSAPWSTGSSSILKDALFYYRGFHQYTSSRSSAQNIVSSMHLYPDLLSIKRFRRGCVRNISSIRRGTIWNPGMWWN